MESESRLRERKVKEERRGYGGRGREEETRRGSKEDMKKCFN